MRAVAFLLVAAAVQAGELVPDGAMEPPFAHGLPRGWVANCWGRNTVSFSRGAPHGGKASLQVAWRYPDEAMCGNSPVGGEDKVWCGGGWTGQPLVWERPDGVTELIFGAYDKHIHFVDADTGEDTRPPFDMGDIIKGTVTLDPDGHPLLYAGSRDSRFRIIALDRPVPRPPRGNDRIGRTLGVGPFHFLTLAAHGHVRVGSVGPQTLDIARESVIPVRIVGG